jgi:hypothetical protein
MGLVDHSTEEWSKWYMKMHHPIALQKIADSSYKLIEIHFLYSFGLKVHGYFQFFLFKMNYFFRKSLGKKNYSNISRWH